ncbi:MAG TPA: glycosyltransferase family 4 protein [Polyangiales bacterium]|jgi:glycosyltransferase involved in cell wall biosynthesis
MKPVELAAEAGSSASLRIVFLCEQYPPIVWDGVGIYTRDIAHALVKLGHEVHVLCAQGYRIKDEVDAGVHVHRRPLFRIPISRYLGPLGPIVAGRDYPRDSISLRIALTFSYGFWLRRLNVKPDVIETQEGETRALSIALRHDLPLVVHLHTPTMLDLRMRDGKLRPKGELADRLDQISARRADALTCPSDFLVQTLRDYRWLSPQDDVEIIPLPFEPGPLAALAPPRATEPVVLTVGRLEWRKGPDVLIEAAGRLLARGVPIKLVFCGGFAGTIEGTPVERWLTDRARALGVNCHFAGHVNRDALVGHYASARVVAVPSRFENFPIAALEGLASGRPVVATSSNGLASHIARWECGTVVAPADPQALADALAPYLLDAEHAVRVGARGRVGTATLDAVQVARQRERVYRRAIANHRARSTV